MRHLGRRPFPSGIGAATGLRPLLGLLSAVALVVAARGAEARDVTIRGLPEKGFGRVELSFSEATKVSLRANGAILVIGFEGPTRIKSEKLAEDLGSYVSAVRRDPDGTGIRLALARPLRTNRLEAGERVYVDLLPERWSGLPPALPPEVVAALAERARIAEEKLKQDTARRIGPARPVRLRLAQGPERTRLVFEPPAGTPMRFSDSDGGTALRLEGHLALDLGEHRPRTAAGVADFEVTRDDDGLTVRVAVKDGRQLRSFLDEGTAVVDLQVPPRAPDAVASSPVAPAVAAPVVPPGRQAAAEAPPSALPAAPREAVRSTPAAAPAPDPLVPGATEPHAGRVVRIRAEGGAQEPALVFPFARPTAAAAFERGGRTTVLFQTADTVEVDDLPAAVRQALGFAGIVQQGGHAVLSFETGPERPLRLVADGNAWRVAAGAAAAPADEVLASRAGGADGRGEVTVALAGTSVHWLLRPDDVPLAIVPTPAHQGLANGRRFVEFQLLPTMQGLVVQPNADGVQVALGRGGVVVTRRGGLALSTVGQPGGGGETHPFVVRSEDWATDSSGDVMSRYRDLVAAAAEAPRMGKAALRFGLARLMLANGMSHEALNVLTLASNDDPLFARRRETMLATGIAASRAGRPGLARRFLSDETLGTDPEAALWLAGLDAEAGDWARALAGLRRGEPVLTRYPDELIARFRLLTARAAAAVGDAKSGDDALSALEKLPLGAVDRDDFELVRALVDEAAGRTTPAMAAYERLADAPARPVAAEATLRTVQLGRRTARLTAPDAIGRLETLAVSWRGDAIELGTLGQLVRLYGETKRWRDMLAVARLANLRFPDRDETRRLYAEAVGWFEALFLGREGNDLDAVEYLALYYDFREFAPVGRRGDEIVRRLADRLVEIDLLDQAATLLQHQVDHRLTGIARATVATRLAALRLMGGKPDPALTALQASRLTDLPAPLRRLRLVIEAQAQADLSRVDLALETVEGEEGADFARLRATIYFNARRWREAGEAYEGLLGTRWKDKEGLTQEERQDVVRAVLAGTLAQETLALDRIRSKFGAKMADSPDSKLFETLMRPRSVQTPEFRTALREASRSDNLRRFLSDWSRISDLPAETPESPGKAIRAETGSTTRG